jgi:hypothetical protein
LHCKRAAFTKDFDWWWNNKIYQSTLRECFRFNSHQSWTIFKDCQLQFDSRFAQKSFVTTTDLLSIIPSITTLVRHKLNIAWALGRWFTTCDGWKTSNICDGYFRCDQIRLSLMALVRERLNVWCGFDWEEKNEKKHHKTSQWWTHFRKSRIDFELSDCQGDSEFKSSCTILQMTIVHQPW